jgi:phosphate starvation-inducible PhoH-like protein
LEPVSISPKALARQQRKEKSPTGVITPRNEKQAQLLALFKKYPVVFAVGVAGSGKTYLAARFALQQISSKLVERLVMSRATASAARHKLGFLPGGDTQKMAPWLVPIMTALREGARQGELEKYQNEKRIEILPFEHMQGRTVKDGVFLLDEAQNCTFGDLEMFITRIGENAQIIICGDPDQVVPGIDSGLVDIIDMVETYGLNAGVIYFDENDVVRSETASEWVKAFKKRRKTHGISLLQSAA